MKLFKSKKQEPTLVTKQPEPRSLEEIQKVYAELCKRAGELQYKMTINKRDLEQINTALESVNHEAAARQKLDVESKKEESNDGK